MYAVIKTGGKQYRVSEQDVLQVEKIAAEEGKSVTFEEVLMVGGESGIHVGTPTVEGASVVAEILEQTRARKIVVFKKRRRKGYRSKNGHRQFLTTIRINEILAGKEFEHLFPVSNENQNSEQTDAGADSQTESVGNQATESAETIVADSNENQNSQQTDAGADSQNESGENQETESAETNVADSNENLNSQQTDAGADSQNESGENQETESAEANVADSNENQNSQQTDAGADSQSEAKENEEPESKKD